MENRPVLIAGTRARPQQVIDAVLELCFTALDTPVALHDLFVNPRALGDVAATAVDTLSHRHAATIVDADPHAFSPGGVLVPLGPPSWLHVRPRNPVLAAIQLSVHGPLLGLAEQLTFRTVTPPGRFPLREHDARLRLPRDSPAKRDLPITAVPQVLWSGVLPSPLADLPDRRAVAALLLLKSGRAEGWRQLIVELGLPAHLGRQLPALWRRLKREPASAKDLLIEIETLYRYLQNSPPPIDYQVRRIIGDDVTLLTDTVQAVSARQDGFLTISRRFWERFTGGDCIYAPEPLRLRLGSQAHGDYLSRVPELDANPSCFAGIFALLKRSAALQVRGPLEWRPP